MRKRSKFFWRICRKLYLFDLDNEGLENKLGKVE